MCSAEKKMGCRHTSATGSPKKCCIDKQIYTIDNSKSNQNRNKQIGERLALIPKAYRATYKKAIQGKSLRAAINAQCLMCVCWQRKEITLCSDLACPLYAVRPYQRISQKAHQDRFSSVESKKLIEGGNGQ